LIGTIDFDYLIPNFKAKGGHNILAELIHVILEYGGLGIIINIIVKDELFILLQVEDGFILKVEKYDILKLN